MTPISDSVPSLLQNNSDTPETDVTKPATTTADGSSSTAPSIGTPNAAVSRSAFILCQHYQHLLDKSTPFLLHRWIGFLIIAVIYAVRVLYIQGFYVVSYALGIYILNLLIGFLSPQVDPEFLDLSDGPSLPIRSSDEFRPFVRRLPEFKFWYSITKAFFIAFVLTFFSVFDVPVFWPILLFYWVVLFGFTMKKQILHMVKYKYVPFSFGKQRYDGKMASSSSSEDVLPKE
ncbi:hypothetical protein L6452_41200 [Arctium lappa]|uniref:Uncharacterized protein n=1 Tax=Arctium lappa TaxID=4217 RepID=A0ACB8XNZ0_ARCLA|nr:hypothetical protein L6452_41200 [Arctium lappa]